MKPSNTAFDLKRQIASLRGVQIAKQELLLPTGHKLGSEHWTLRDLSIGENSVLLLRIKERYEDLNVEQIDRMKGFTLLLIQGIEVCGLWTA